MSLHLTPHPFLLKTLFFQEVCSSLKIKLYILSILQRVMEQVPPTQILVTYFFDFNDLRGIAVTLFLIP